MLLCQISDLHIKAGGKKSYGVVDTAGMLRACVAQVLAAKQRPDVVVVTGDLVDFGREDEYAMLRELLAPLPMPMYLIPGNHDDRDVLRKCFPDHAYLRDTGRFCQYVVDDHPVRIVAIDTVVPGKSGGTLCEERLAWLDATLAARPAAPTVVLMHHPPFTTRIGHMDRIGLAAGTEALRTIIQRNPQVERVLCGHLHRPIQVRFGGTIASTCPSPAHQVALDLDDDAPSRFMMEPPGYQLHAWRPETGIVSHTAYIGTFAGPYPFYDPGGKLLD
jgi:3',5'-cyclic AMP phosphodiesterase CpdA